MRQHTAEYRRMITSARWRRLRAGKLAAEPLCERCRADGYVTAATEVHHRVPVESGTDTATRARYMYDPRNLMSVCRQCHRDLHVLLDSHSRAGNLARQRAMAQAAGRRLFGLGPDDTPGGVFKDRGT